MYVIEMSCEKIVELKNEYLWVKNLYNHSLKLKDSKVESELEKLGINYDEGDINVIVDIEEKYDKMFAVSKKRYDYIKLQKEFFVQGLELAIKVSPKYNKDPSLISELLNNVKNKQHVIYTHEKLITKLIVELVNSEYN